MKKCSVNENFFKTWTPEMSYILGFITADGCVYKRKNRKNSYVLNITNKEKEHLEKIKKVLETSAAISAKASSTNKKKEYYALQVCNKKIANDLINLGIVPRKTYYLKPLKIPNQYFADFARGFFDGDGSVYIYNVNRIPQIKVGFVSVSLPFITDFNRRLFYALGIPEKAIHQNPEDRKTGRVKRYNTCFYISDCEKFADFMYGNNPTLYLPRKRKVFENWKTIKRRHYIKQNYPSKIGWHLNQVHDAVEIYA